MYSAFSTPYRPIYDPRRWVRSGSRDIAIAVGDVADVKYFGAVGDGVTDDTQAFLDAIASNLAIIWVPAGRYRITATLVLGRAQTLRGPIPTGGSANTGTNAILIHDFNGTFIKLDGSAGNILGAGGGVENLQLMQNNGSGATGVGVAIQLYASNSSFRSVWTRIHNVQIEPPDAGQAPWTWGIDVDGSLATGTSEGIRDLYISNIRIAGTQVFNPATPSNGGGMRLYHASNIFLNNLEFNSTGAFTDPALYIDGPNATDISTNINISAADIAGTLYLGDNCYRTYLFGGIINACTVAGASVGHWLHGFFVTTPVINGLAVVERITDAGTLTIQTSAGLNLTVGTVAVGTDITFAPSSPVLANGDNNNVGTAQSSSLRITGPTAAFAITGLSGGINGKHLHLINQSGQVATLKENSASSAAANRIYNYGLGNIVGWHAVLLEYDGVNSLWDVISWS